MDKLLPKLLRRTAQQVTILSYPYPNPIHGITLSSFTSVSLYPSELVSFSIRVPSLISRLLHEQPNLKFRLDLLDHTQQETANVFARQSPPSTPEQYRAMFDQIHAQSLGSLIAHLVYKVDLSNPQLKGITMDGEVEQRVTQPQSDRQFTSELYLAQVDEVIMRPETDHSKPLIYHHRAYTTVK